MSAPRKFDEEIRARAVRLYQNRLRNHGESKLAARKHVGQLDLPEAGVRHGSSLLANPKISRGTVELDHRLSVTVTAARGGERVVRLRVRG